MHTKQEVSPGCDPQIARWPTVNSRHLCTSVALIIKLEILSSLSLLWIDSLSHIFQHCSCLSLFSISTPLTPPPALLYPLSTKHLISFSYVDNWSHLLMVHPATTFSFSQGLRHMASRISILQPSSDDGSLKPAEFSSQSGPTLWWMAILPLL